MNEMSVLHGVPNPPPVRPTQMLCDKCQSGWFIKLRILQLQIHQVLIGEEGMGLDPAFFLYECVACGQVAPPPTAYTGLSGEQKIYEELLRIVDATNKRKKCACPA